MEDLGKVAVAAAAAVSGPDTPEAVKVTQKDDRLSIWARVLAGPAISALVVLVIAVLTPLRLPIVGQVATSWTAASEVVRAHYVGGIGVALAIMLGLLIWRLVGGRPSKIEVKAGPGSILIEGGDG